MQMAACRCQAAQLTAMHAIETGDKDEGISTDGVAAAAAIVALLIAAPSSEAQVEQEAIARSN